MSYYHSSYFPARNIFKKSSDGGAWLVAYKEEQKKRFNAVLCPSTQEESKKSKKASKLEKLQPLTKNEKVKILDGVYLLKHMNVNYPSDLAYINIIGENLTAGKAEDFVLFDNVQHIEAGENNLTLDTFKKFPDLCELAVQLNGITSLDVTSSDFRYLEVLNLSFNNLKPAEILCLGTLVSLKCLHLTGNCLKVLPAELANKQKRGSRNSRSKNRRFQKLEVLYLDENDIEDISVFASLASLPKLKVLNLAKNKLQCVPQLRLMVSNLDQAHMLPTADYIDQKGEFEGHDIAEATHEKSNDPKSGEAVRENNDNNSGDIDLQRAANPTEEVQLGHPLEKPQEESGKQNVEGLADDRISANPTEEVQLGHPLEKPQEESGKQNVEGSADDRISANPTEEVQLGHPLEKPQEESGKQNVEGLADDRISANPTEEVQLGHPLEKPQEESGKQKVEGLADDRISANPTEEVQLGHPHEKPQEESGKQKVEGLADDRRSANPTEEVQLGHPHEKPQEESGKQNVEGLAHDWRSGNSFHDDFQYEKHVEDDNLGLDLGINEQETDTDLSGDSGDHGFFLDDLECPFPSLQKIDLTHNLIAEDQALLPLTTWPSLLEVNIWKNPLVKNRRGISALLQYNLTNLCGIKINRKEPGKSCRPSVGLSIAPVARYNKVNDVVHPLRQKNMLLLEFEKYEASVKNSSLTEKPLPSISSGRDESIARKRHSAPVRQFIEAADEITAQRSLSAANLRGNRTFEYKKDAPDFDNSKNGFQFEDDQSGVFLTQVDVNDEESETALDKEDIDPVNDTEIDYKATECTEEVQKFDTIEALLKTDESIEFTDTPAENDVHANIKALKMALSNPLVFNESSQKSSKETKYARPPLSRKTISPRKTRQDHVLSTLDGMKKQNNIVEENLDVVLENYDKDTKLKRQFPNVKRLLKDVQSKYDQVRLTSLDSARNAQSLMQSTIKNAYDNHTNPSVKRRQNQPEESKPISSRSIAGIRIDSSNDAIKTLDRFKEAVNSRI